MVKVWGRLHLAHRKFSSINANFLPPINDGISKNKEMRERSRVDWVVGRMVVLPLRPSVENWDAEEEECRSRHMVMMVRAVCWHTSLEIGFRGVGFSQESEMYVIGICCSS